MKLNKQKLAGFLKISGAIILETLLSILCPKLKGNSDGKFHRRNTKRGGAKR